MSDPSAFTRRQFLAGLAMVSTAATVPAFLESSVWALDTPEGTAHGSTPGVPDERILVVIQLTGGNDGLNTVVPYGMSEYYDARPRIAIKAADALKTSVDGIGLNPDMGALKSMLDQGMATVVQGVGYPNPNRSHFTSMDIWNTADPTAAARGLGWLGRAMDEQLAENHGQIDPTACICIGHDTPLAANGQSYKPISLERANLFRWVGSDLHPVLAKEYDVIDRAGVLPGVTPSDQGGQAAFVMRTALDAQLASDKIRSALATGPITAFPHGALADQLRMVAAMIRAGLPTRVYYVTLGGFDTHANQPNTQGRQLKEFTTATQAFYAELKAMGQQQRVLSLAFTEFGRRVQQNASNGTDHGTAGPVFLFGDMVNPGVLGTHPSMAANALDHGDLVYNVDFRCIYASILQNWMKIDAYKVLGQSFQPAQVLNARVLG